MIALVGGVLLAAAGACGGKSLPTAATTTTTSTTSTTSTTIGPTTTAPAPSDPDSTSAGTSVATSTTTIADESSAAPQVLWQADDGFLLGANLPWYNLGCDFGCGLGAREGAGVSSEEVRSVVAPAIGQASDAGMSVVRWWTFPGEPWQIITDSDGYPSGIDEVVYADFDAALALADFFDVSYIFTIFSAPSEIPEAWLTTEEGRQRLADVLGELFARYGDHPRIMTWQLVNEPEWEIWNDIVEVDPLRDLVTKVSAAIHENSTALASIGSANLEGLEFWRDTGLDYYTAHWYDPMSSGLACAICTSYSEIAATLDVDLPIVIGEFYAGTDVDPEARLDAFYLKGYAGAWAWSLLPERTEDRLPIDFDAVAAFAANRSADIAP